MYQNGLGVKQDYQTAIKLFTLSAQQDNPKAHNSLGKNIENSLLTLIGDIYLNGLGVPKDRQKAIQHLTIAANKGDDDAKTTLQSLKGCAQQ